MEPQILGVTPGSLLCHGVAGTLQREVRDNIYEYVGEFSERFVEGHCYLLGFHEYTTEDVFSNSYHSQLKF